MSAERGWRRGRRRAERGEVARRSWGEAVRQAQHNRAAWDAACREAVRESGPGVPVRGRRAASARTGSKLEPVSGPAVVVVAVVVVVGGTS